MEDYIRKKDIEILNGYKILAKLSGMNGWQLTYPLSLFDPKNWLDRNDLPVEPLCVCMNLWPRGISIANFPFWIMKDEGLFGITLISHDPGTSIMLAWFGLSNGSFVVLRCLSISPSEKAAYLSGAIQNLLHPMVIYQRSFSSWSLWQNCCWTPFHQNVSSNSFSFSRPSNRS